MTAPQTSENLDELISYVREHPHADFYRTRWGEADTFDELPTISRKDFLDVPLSRRRYKDARSLVKIVHDEDRMFLSEWSFADIGHEPWGIPSSRPMVYLNDPHEAIEKSMWCYENNMVPLIGEKDSAIAMFAAEKYRVDSLITDAISLSKLLPFLEREKQPLSSITVIGDSFDAATLMPYADLADHVRLVLCLPETGVFAESPLMLTPLFVATPGSILEDNAGNIVVTKTGTLVTPIIRYRTDIPAAWIGGDLGKII